MANKYSRYQLQPYVSQYVDPGTTQINAMLRQRWETNKAKHDQLQQLANSTQVGKGDQKWKDAAIDEIRTTFNDTIQTNAYENAGVVVSDAVNSFIANEPLKAAAESYQWWQKGQETKFELQAQGKNVLFDKVTLKDENGNIQYDELGQPIWVDPFEMHSSYSQNEESGETSVNIYKPEIATQLDWQGEMDRLVSGMQNMDPVLLQRYNLTNEELDGYLMYGVETSPETLKKMAALLMDNYMSSDEGIQQNRYLLEQGINPTTGQHYDASEAYEKILGQLEATALKNKSVNLNYREDKAYWEMLKALADSGDEDAKQILTAPTISQGIKYNVDPFTPLDFMSNKKHRKEGKLKDKYFSNGMYLFETGDLKGKSLSTALAKYETIEEMQEAMETELQDYINSYSDVAGEFDGETSEFVKKQWIAANKDLYLANLMFQNKDAYFAMENGERIFKTDKEFFEAISTSMEEIKNQHRTMHTVSNPYSDYMIEQIDKGTYNQVPWYFTNPDTGETSTSKDEFLDFAAQHYKRGNRKGEGSRVGYGNTKEAIKAALADKENNLKVSGFMPAGSGPGTYVVTLSVPDNSGDSGNEAFDVTFEIASIDDIQGIFQDSHDIVSNFAQGNFDWEGEVFLGNGYDENGLMIDAADGTFDYVFDATTKSWQTRGVIRTYAAEDLDLNGRPKEGATPTHTETLVGNQLIEKMLEKNMQALYLTPHYEAFITGQTEKGVVKPVTNVFQ